MDEFIIKLNRSVNFSAVTIEDCMFLHNEKGIQTIIEDGKVAGFCEEWTGNKAPSDYS